MGARNVNDGLCIARCLVGDIGWRGRSSVSSLIDPITLAAVSLRLLVELCAMSVSASCMFQTKEMSS